MGQNEQDLSLNPFYQAHYEFERQEAFCDLVRGANFPRDISYLDFINYFPSVDSSTLILGFLDHKKETYKGKVNMVNYAATLAEGSLKGNYESARQESLKNLSSLVIEHPLAEVCKRQEWRLAWEPFVLPDGRGQIRLVSESSDMDSLLEESLRSTQPAEFEHKRYEANLVNYHTLQNAREKGDHRTFVEFSPSPELTPEAKERGYFGMDAIFFYTYDKETGEEKIEQRWLKAEHEDYWRLIGDLEMEEYMYLSEGAVGIMRKSRFLDSIQEEKVKKFIDDKNGKFIKQPELEIFRYEDLQPKIQKMVEPIIQIAAQKMILGLPIEKELEELEATGAYLQHLLREKIKELLGVDKTRITISQEDKNLIENDTAYRVIFVERNKNKMPLGGCGGNNEEDSNGRTISMLDVFKDEHGALKFKCPVCKEIHERTRGEFLQVCISSRSEYRGRPIPQC